MMRQMWRLGAASVALIVMTGCAGRVPNQAGLAASPASTTPSTTTPSYSSPGYSTPSYSDPYSSSPGYGSSPYGSTTPGYGTTTGVSTNQQLVASVDKVKNGSFMGIGKFSVTVKVSNPASWYAIAGEGMARVGGSRFDGGTRFQVGDWPAPKPREMAEVPAEILAPDWALTLPGPPQEPTAVLTPSNLGGAKALPGWTLDATRTTVVFDATRWATTTKTFLGQTGNWEMDDLVNIICQQPATADYLCRKIYKYFLDDEPDPADVAALATTLRNNNYAMAPMLSQIRPTLRMPRSDVEILRTASGEHGHPRVREVRGFIHAALREAERFVYVEVQYFTSAGIKDAPVLVNSDCYGQAWMIDFRRGGGRLKPAPNGPTRGLKAHYQALGVPAWERERAPLVWAGHTLLFAAGIGMDCRCMPDGEGERVALRWVPDPIQGG